MLEEEFASLDVSNRQISLEFRPFEIKTVRLTVDKP